MNIQAAQKYITDDLIAIYPKREAKNIANLLLEAVLQCSATHLVLHQQSLLSDQEQCAIEAALSELRQHKPIQYVLGEADFYDLQFKVNEHTLIPRAETEELVHRIIADWRGAAPRLIDIGTGSGCIPITLAKHIEQSSVGSVDISAEAIAVAQENAKINDVDIDFYHRDILKWKQYDWDKYDVVVSNPPYVCDAEKAQMCDNVLKYEPHTALFVDDQQPLLFYVAIADFAKAHLKPNGKIYFEINENFGQETLQLLKDKGFLSVELLADIHGKDRIVVGAIS